MPTVRERFQSAWNAFNNKDTAPRTVNYNISTSSIRPDRPKTTKGNERSIITAIYNRIANDVASIKIEHVRLDDNGRYMSTIDSGLNNCLTLEANLDQTGRAFIIDTVMSMLDEGCIALVPTSATANINYSRSFDVLELRTAKILEWKPNRVRVRVYNQDTGKYEELELPKRSVAIIENPFFAVMNEPNSTLKRLIRKLNLLDVIDEQSGSGKLNMIIQLPYTIKTEARRQQAEERRKAIEDQLVGSKYGIAYADASEKITQLGRSLDNNLMNQIEYLTRMLYSQLSMTSEILDGTANETTMLNYTNRTIEVILSAIVDEMKRKFLTKTARTQNQSIVFFREPFKLVPVNNIAEIADKFTRNEIMSSNEIRQVIGLKPIADPKADELRNKNLNATDGQEFASTNPEMAGMPSEDMEGQMYPEDEMAPQERMTLDDLMSMPVSSVRG